MGLTGDFFAHRGREIIQTLTANLLALYFAIRGRKEGKEEDLSDNDEFHFDDETTAKIERRRQAWFAFGVGSVVAKASVVGVQEVQRWQK